jgi:hypothetical protein
VRLKTGVKMEGVQPEIVLALCVADAVLRSKGFDLVVTSIADGKHSANSLHYSGRAADVRSRDIPVGERHAVREALEFALGQEFDVVLEKDHYHIELDPGPKEIPT